MSRIKFRLKKRKRAMETIIDLAENSSHSLIIHYSCESFYDIKDGRTPRVTSIAVKYMKTGQTKSFSIHKTAERKKVNFEKIEEHYDELEKDMLADFFSFVDEHKHYRWIPYMLG